MGWFSFLLCAAPAYLFWKAGSYVLLAVAGLNALLNFWSFGVMHNYAVSASASRIRNLRENLAMEGHLDAERQAALDRLRLKVNPEAVPNWLATVNFATTVLGLAGLVVALVAS